MHARDRWGIRRPRAGEPLCTCAVRQRYRDRARLEARSQRGVPIVVRRRSLAARGLMIVAAGLVGRPVVNLAILERHCDAFHARELVGRETLYWGMLTVRR